MKKRSGLETAEPIRAKTPAGPVIQTTRGRAWDKENPPLSYRVPQEQREPLMADVKRLIQRSHPGAHTHRNPVARQRTHLRVGKPTSPATLLTTATSAALPPLLHLSLQAFV